MNLNHETEKVDSTHVNDKRMVALFVQTHFRYTLTFRVVLHCAKASSKIAQGFAITLYLLGRY